jgi:hypothetical protein
VGSARPRTSHTRPHRHRSHAPPQPTALRLFALRSRPLTAHSAKARPKSRILPPLRSGPGALPLAPSRTLAAAAMVLLSTATAPQTATRLPSRLARHRKTRSARLPSHSFTRFARSRRRRETPFGRLSSRASWFERAKPSRHHERASLFRTTSLGKTPKERSSFEPCLTSFGKTPFARSEDSLRLRDRTKRVFRWSSSRRGLRPLIARHVVCGGPRCDSGRNAAERGSSKRNEPFARDGVPHRSVLRKL